MSITVAITSYNAKTHLERLLPELKNQGFTDIVVLDDASTDGTAEWLKTQANVTIVAGATNIGPTANRNRTLEHQTGDIILFLDVDMQLVSHNIAATLQQTFTDHPEAAVVGSLILGGTDEPMWYNWGHEFNPRLDGSADVLNQMALANWHNPAIMTAVREAAAGKVAHFEPIENRAVDWTSEAFFAVRTTVFRELKGFDEGFRMFHEGPDYCRRARLAGHTIWFTPDITAKHLDLASGSPEQRQADLDASTRRYYQKHFGVTREVYDALFDA